MACWFPSNYPRHRTKRIYFRFLSSTELLFSEIKNSLTRRIINGRFAGSLPEGCGFKSHRRYFASKGQITGSSKKQTKLTHIQVNYDGIAVHLRQAVEAYAPVAKSVEAVDLKSTDSGREGSSPSGCTNLNS